MMTKSENYQAMTKQFCFSRLSFYLFQMILQLSPSFTMTISVTDENVAVWTSILITSLNVQINNVQIQGLSKTKYIWRPSGAFVFNAFVQIFWGSLMKNLFFGVLSKDFEKLYKLCNHELAKIFDVCINYYTVTTEVHMLSEKTMLEGSTLFLFLHEIWKSSGEYCGMHQTPFRCVLSLEL